MLTRLLHTLAISRSAGCHVLAAVLLLAFSSSAAIAAGNDVAAEYQIKAAMLYKFVSYTTWPDEVDAITRSPYRIWVLGENHIGDELQAIVAGRMINGRAIQAFSAKTIEKIVEPHIVFVSREQQKQLDALRVLAEQKSFLIVTEDEQGLKPGSTINLRLIDGRISFDVSLASAQQYNLKLSSRLLSVAASVQEKNP